MCGINGILYLGKNKDSESQDSIRRMNEKIRHRGPDDSGIYEYQKKLLMGMTRLSIIDLQGGHQPMYSEDNNIVITFNGEIYNHISLRKKLLNKGVRFNTQSDTEVILKMYQIYGIEFLEVIEGMFSIAIHDVTKDKIFIARDRFGEKPLYYGKINNIFYWASELKSIQSLEKNNLKLDSDALIDFFNLTYIPAPKTIYEEISKLEPGKFIEINLLTEEIKISSYYEIPFEKDKTVNSYSNAKLLVHDMLSKSVDERMVSDVPIGSLLSGGVDSAIVTALMSKLGDSKINTFTVGFKEEKYNEARNAETLSKHLNTNHHTFILDSEDLLHKMKSIILNFDEPFADPSALPTEYISRKASEYVKVILTGDGADEVFGGYNKYLIHNYGNYYKKLNKLKLDKYLIEPIINLIDDNSFNSRSIKSKYEKFKGSINSDTITNHLSIQKLGFKNSEIKRLLKVNSRSKELNDFGRISQFPTVLQKAKYLDFKISLEGDMLVKVDRVSMLNSLETRSPFLDSKLVELSFLLKDQFLIKGFSKKRILKDTFKDYMPKNYFNSPKRGFEMPIGDWFRKELSAELKETLSTNNLLKYNLLNPEYVQEIVHEHLTSLKDHTFKLWTLYCFQTWCNNNLSNES